VFAFSGADRRASNSSILVAWLIKVLSTKADKNARNVSSAQIFLVKRSIKNQAPTVSTTKQAKNADKKLRKKTPPKAFA
jgi:hypothetical protein